MMAQALYWCKVVALVLVVAAVALHGIRILQGGRRLS